MDCILPDYDCKTCFCSHSCQVYLSSDSCVYHFNLQNEQSDELVSSSDPKGKFLFGKRHSCTSKLHLFQRFHPAAEYQSMHLPLGVPRGGEGDGACLLTNKHSVSLFSTVLHIPVWVAFTLTSQVHVCLCVLL